MAALPQLERVRFLWHRLRQQLWWRPALWSLAAVLAALASALVDAWVPAHWLPRLQDDLVSDLLHIMASSMLAVSTFALSVLVGAYASAASAGTPRATRLVVADPQSQKAVAVFLASFIFSIVGVIALGTGRYGPAGRMALFVCALVVLGWVVIAFMRYIDLLSRIGRVSHTIERVERATCEALRAAARCPLGGACPADAAPSGARAVLAQRTGHVQFVDVAALQRLAEEIDGHVHVAAQAGDLVHPTAPLAWLQGAAMDAAQDEALRSAFVIDVERTIEQDIGYGLIVLAEIAERALSPAVNDPGTAIAVIGSQTRLLIEHLATPIDAQCKRLDRVSARPSAPAALVAIAYEPIARCGLNQPEVMRQWLRHLDALAGNAPPEILAAVRELVQRVLARAARAAVDAADLAHWHDEARALGLLAPAAAGSAPR